MRKQHRTQEEAIRFARQSLSAFKHVLATKQERLNALLAERAKVDERIAAFERDCADAPAAIARIERDLEELEKVRATQLYGGGSGRYQPTKVDSMVRRRAALLKKVAALEAQLPPELRKLAGGGS